MRRRLRTVLPLAALVLAAGCGDEPRYGSPAQLAESLGCDHKAVYDGTAGDEDDGVVLGTCERYEGTQLVLLVARDEATRKSYVDKALTDSRATPQPLTALEGPLWAAFAPEADALDAAREVLVGTVRSAP